MGLLKISQLFLPLNILLLEKKYFCLSKILASMITWEAAVGWEKSTDEEILESEEFIFVRDLF